MKSSFRSPLAGISGAFALALFTGMPVTAHALTWFDGSGLWDNISLSWDGGTTAWSPNAAAIFSGGPDTVIIGDDLQIASITFAGTAGAYTFDNTAPGWTMDINGSGISTTSGATQLFMNAGTMNFNNGASAGSTTIQIDSTSLVNFNDTATAGTSTLINNGDLTFAGTATSAGSTITNSGNLYFNAGSTGGATTLVNGGAIDISAHTGGLTLASLNNDSGGLAGAVDVGLNTLTLTGGLTLSSNPGNALAFKLLSPTSSADGSIIVGTTFTGSVGAGSTTISLSGPATPGAPGVPFVLIDWTAGSASGVDITDFAFAGGAAPGDIGLAGYHLAIAGNQLVLVPEPATFAMPLAAALGMLTLRRRNKRQVS